MANFMKIAGKIMTMLPKTEGAVSRVTLGKTQLNLIGKADKNVGKILQRELQGLKNPTLDIAYKAKSNYSIAGLRLKDGNKVIEQGALSVTNPGSSQAVLKYKASMDGGKKLAANGFIDGGKQANAQDMALSFARKNGMVKGDIQIGEATAHHLAFNEQAAVDLAKDFNANTFLTKYAQATRKLQQNLDAGMVNIRNIFSGKTAIFTPIKAQKVAPENLVKAKDLKCTKITQPEPHKIFSSKELIAKLEKSTKWNKVSPEFQQKILNEIKTAYPEGKIPKNFSLNKYLKNIDDV